VGGRSGEGVGASWEGFAPGSARSAATYVSSRYVYKVMMDIAVVYSMERVTARLVTPLSKVLNADER
jgi:hypothetical protein